MALWRFSFSIAVDNMAPFLPFRFRIFRLDFVARVYTAPHIHFDDYGLVIVALRSSSIFLSLPPTGSLSLFLFPRWAMAKSICMDSTCVCFLSINFNYDKLIRVSIYLLSSPLLLMVFSAKHPLQHIILILLLTTAARNTYTHTHGAAYQRQHWTKLGDVCRAHCALCRYRKKCLINHTWRE